VLRVIEGDNDSVVEDIPVRGECGLGRCVGWGVRGRKGRLVRGRKGRRRGRKGRFKRSGRESGPMINGTVVGHFPFPSDGVCLFHSP
jgi:hypothetical protein